MSRSHTPPRPAAPDTLAAHLALMLASSDATLEKLTWVIEQYLQLLPVGQDAIDKCLVALVRRPGSTTRPQA